MSELNSMSEFLLPESSFLPQVLLWGRSAFHGQFPSFLYSSDFTRYMLLHVCYCISLEQEC